MAEMEKKSVPVESAPPTEEESQLITKLKQEFEGKEYDIDDGLYLRFTRAFESEEDREQKAIESLEATMKWRKDINIEELCVRAEVKFDSFKKHWPLYFHGVDRQGHPIWIEQMGLAGPNELKENGFCDQDILDFHVHVQEKNELLKAKLTKERDLLIYQHVAIIDLQGFGKKHVSKKFLTPSKQCIEMLQDYYPGTLFRMYIINAPYIFRKLWKVVKRWVDPVAATKILVLGEDFLEEMKKDIGPDNIPGIYGGNCLIDGCNCSEWMTYTKYKKLHKRSRSWSVKKKKEQEEELDEDFEAELEKI